MHVTNPEAKSKGLIAEPFLQKARNPIQMVSILTAMVTSKQSKKPITNTHGNANKKPVNKENIQASENPIVEGIEILTLLDLCLNLLRNELFRKNTNKGTDLIYLYYNLVDCPFPINEFSLKSLVSSVRFVTFAGLAALVLMKIVCLQHCGVYTGLLSYLDNRQ